MDVESRTCCVVGAGPAGMVLGLLLARAGVDVTVVEKHTDFLRDFRGDTVHASTLTLLDELGLGEAFSRLPYRVEEHIRVETAGGGIKADFSHLPGRYQHIAMVPQWHFLDMLAAAATREPTFTLCTGTEAIGLVRDQRRVRGIRYRSADGDSGELCAELTVGCDGRDSLVRTDAGLRTRGLGAPIDVLWFRLPRHQHDMEGLTGRFGTGSAAVVVDRGDYFQVAFIIRKGNATRIRTDGLAAFRQRVAEVMPSLSDRVDALTSWDDVQLLSVTLDRLRRWHTDGALCIGDAAHAMSPIGGIGINLAIQDAVAAAALLAQPLRRGAVTTEQLASVQRRRGWPTAFTQYFQKTVHARVLGPGLDDDSTTSPYPSWMFSLINRFPRVQTLPGYLMGIGVRPEHAPAFARPPAK